MNATARITFAAILTLAAGCASILGRSKYNVYIDTDEEGVRCVVRNHGRHVETLYSFPQTLQLHSAPDGKPASYTFDFTNSTGEKVKEVREAYLSPLFFGNIIIGGFIGIAIDATTGAMWSISDRDVCGNFRYPHNGSYHEPLRNYDPDEFRRRDLKELERDFKEGKISRNRYLREKARLERK